MNETPWACLPAAATAQERLDVLVDRVVEIIGDGSFAPSDDEYEAIGDAIKQWILWKNADHFEVYC